VAGGVGWVVEFATRGDALAPPINNAAPLIIERRLVGRSATELLLEGEEFLRRIAEISYWRKIDNSSTEEVQKS